MSSICFLMIVGTLPLVSSGKCFLILTSRPDLPSSNGHYVSQEIRSKMDGEVIIEGFNEENIRKCSDKYLENEDSAIKMISEAKEVGIYDLLKIPIVLLMTCVIYFEQKSLPRTMTKIYSQIFEMIINRTAIKAFNPGLYADVKEYLDVLLCALGELSWNALQNDVQQLLLNKGEVEKKSVVLLKLGLLFETGYDQATERESPTFVAFQHKSFQEYTTSFFIRRELEKADNQKETLKQLFPSWYHVKRYEEILIFTCGLMSDPHSLIEHVSEMFVERETLLIRGGDDEREAQLSTMGKSVLVLNLIRSLYAEANVPLEDKPHHNKILNLYSHKEDDFCRRPRDTQPIETPSQFYEFLSLKESLQPYNMNWHIMDDTNCISAIEDTHSSIANSLLLICREISRNQSVMDLWMHGFHCDTSQVAPVEVFNMSETAQSITIANCTLPVDVMEHLIGQVSKCRHLRKLHIQNVILYNVPSKEIFPKQKSDAKMSAVSQTSKSVLKFRNTSQLQDNPLHSITKYITSGTRIFQGNHSLRQLTLIKCLPPGDTCSFLSKCKRITHLNLNGNKLGNTGILIARSIENFGLDSHLQLLYLRNCSIPSNICVAILKSLQKCKQLTHLDFSGNSIRHHGQYLVDLLKKFGVDSLLQQLYLSDCSISETVCTEMLRCLSNCRHLTHLDLNGNTIRKGGIHIVEMIDKLRLGSQLKLLYLRDCSIPSSICGEILKSLQKCMQLTHLDFGGNNMGSDGKYVRDLVRNFGEDPPVQQLYLPECSIPEVECTEMLKYLSTYRHLTHFSIGGIKMGKGGIHIVEMIDNLGIDSQLQLLYLRNCLMPSNICEELLKCLKKCKQLTHLDFGGNYMGSHGKYLVDIIKSFGVGPALQQLYLPNCSIPETDCIKMLRYLTKYRHLTHLNLNRNNLGKGGIKIVKIMENLELAAQLQLLYLRDCSIPSNICGEILKSLQKCKQLTHLDFGGNNMGSDGKYLIDLIKNFGEDPPVQQLYLPECSLPEAVCTEMLKYLSKYRHLTHLNLDGNKLGKGGIHIVDMIDNSGMDSQLQLLSLIDCSISSNICGEMLKYLKRCKQLTELHLGGNNVGSKGKFLANMFEKDSPLQKLNLSKCSILEMQATDTLKNLSTCQNLIYLDLSGNILGKGVFQLIEIISKLTSLYLADINMTGECCKRLLQNLQKCEDLILLSLKGNNLTGLLSHCLPDPDSVLPSLRYLDLGDVGLNEDDVNHLKTLIESHRIPALGGPGDSDALWLDGNNLAEMVGELEGLLNASVNEHKKELGIVLWNNNLSDDFKAKWAKRCEGTNIKLYF